VIFSKELTGPVRIFWTKYKQPNLARVIIEGHIMTAIYSKMKCEEWHIEKKNI